jgi:hypothetical protein
MIRINDLTKATLKAAAVVGGLLLFAAVATFGQQPISLTAGFNTTTMPDGTVLPMWGYSCGAPVTGSTATCAPLSAVGALSPAALGELGGIYVLNGGSGYTSAPTVTISAPTGITGVTSATATASAVVSGGAVVGINLLTPGAGYTAPPTITFSTGGAVAAAGPAWSPVVITVPTGTVTAPAGLTINLTNNLSFTPATGAANSIPTSIVIVGQVGGGLGLAPSTTLSPAHTNTQGCVTWFIASQVTPPGTPCPGPQSGASGTPPSQVTRVQSMGAEVAAVAPGTGTATPLTWLALKPGTYLLESGTHPSIQVPMGLIGVLVVTTAPTSGTTAAAGIAYPGVAAITNSSGVITTGAIPAVTYGAEVPLEFSEIDPVQNKAVDAAVRTSGFSETRVWSGMVTDPNTGAPGCGNPASGTSYNTCYPPAVNYTPFYYLINGAAFNKNMPLQSVFAATAGTSTTTTTTGSTTTPVMTGITGTVLVRLVNAGLRMHTPSLVNSLTQGFTGAGVSATVAGFTLIAEDGNVLPNVAPPGAATAPAAPRVQTDVLMVPSKVYDALVNVPTAAASGATPAIPIFARDLALSANSSVRDAGMLAYISVNNASAGSGLPVTNGTGVFAGATANPDNYISVAACAAAPCSPLVVSDVSKGVIANDVNVYGVALATSPAIGTLTCTSLGTGLCANGTFTYTPNPGFTATSSDSFGYCANGAAPGTAGLCTTVTLGASLLSGNPVANSTIYASKMATFLKIPSPGVLSVDTDPNNLPLQVVLSSVTPSGVTINMDPTGGFTASAASAGTYSFTYIAQNSQGRQSNSATVTLVFPQPSNLQVKVLDAQLVSNCNGNSACISGLQTIGDYRWIIEEDKTFFIDPNCTTNASITTPGCPNAVGSGGTIPVFGVQFHTSNMDFVAQGCTGPLSCEGGQTMYDPTTQTHVKAVCDVGNGACRPDTTGNGFTAVLPGQVQLDPSKRYYISVLPGDAANPFPTYVGQPACSLTGGTSTTSSCGHTMSGAPVPAVCNILGGPSACIATSAYTQPVTVLVLPTPLPTGNLSLIVFEDDFPLNGEQDGGGGNGTIAPIEPGLGGFNIVLWDTYGGLGDVTGQDTYDTFNQPLSNSLVGTIDPSTGNDACPASTQVSANSALAPGLNPNGLGGDGTPVGSQKGIQGMIVTCPKYESDGQTLSPLAGQAVIANLMPDKFSVQAYPGADRIARGEEWLQTNTLDGQHPHDSFIRIGEPTYFQEYGPAGYHVAIGFANPAIINARTQDVCAGAGSPGAVGPCTNTIDGQVNIQRLSRIPDERLYPSGSHDALAWTQCWVSLGDPDGEDFMFTKCDANGNFKFTGVPGGSWRLTIGDQWNDQIIDGLSTPANVGCAPGATTCATSALHMPNIGIQQWQSNVYTTTFIDDNKNGIKDGSEIGIPLIYTRIYYRDGHNANSLTTDFNGIASFNETFPLFNWYVVEADSTRYKTTGIHTVYDAGGPADDTSSCGTSARPCGTSPSAYKFMANTYESVPLPADLSVPGAVYCAKADCVAEAAGFAAGTAKPSSSTASTGRLDPPWVTTEGWAGLTGQSNWIEFGKAPYASCPPACVTVPNAVSNPTAGGTTASTIQAGENGGIQGFVAYVSTRPFDDASQMIQQPWEPNIPGVTLNLYQEGFAADGVTPTLKLVDTTQTSSWDAWAQGFYPNSSATPGTGQTATQKPYMSCPGQGTNVAGSPNQDLFYFTLFDQPNYLDWYNSVHSAGALPLHPLPYNSQFKCYDSMKINNQIQPAPYDGKYSFPSSLGVDATSGKLLAVNGSTNGVASSLPGTNCTICVKNPDLTDVYRVGTPMLPPGKYVVQVIMPAGYEVYKEEDKNLLIGDNLIAPVTQQFSGLGTDVFIMPDQASIASLYDQSGAGFNPTNYQDATTGLGLADELSGVPGFPGFQDPVWPCVGEMRIVPDYLSLFPHNQEVAPFAGATRPLCDRKEVTLVNQMSVRAHFSLFTSTHIAAKYTGVITDDMTSEFDPFSPQFGEKFAPPNMPISTKDYLGNELSRVYSDHWGVYDGLTFSSWDVNPPNITGYSPSMQTQCMNDPGPILDTRIGSPTIGQMITDPLYNSAYSDFCYEQPYMPGLTVYGDTPVVPTQAFVGAAYNNADCSYPDATPAIKEVDGDGIGPWVSADGKTLTITALGDQQVSNSAYAGPSANVAPFNMKTVTRHYGFGGQCLSPTAGSTTCSTRSSVTIGGIQATVGTWSDTQIQVTVPSGVPLCAIEQQTQYGGSTAQCGQLVITAGNGKQSIDSVSVTIGGKPPTHVAATALVQSAIDAAAPGDLLIIDPTCTTTGATPTVAACSAAAVHSANPAQTASVGSHNEILIMWKPVRLQGVGAASSIINANTFPSGKLLNPWRRHINCLFGLSLAGVPTTTTGGAGSYDPSGVYSCPDAGWNPSTWSGAPNSPQIDRLPLEATVGWDATQNGNLAEQLQEPALMGAYEGAAITVLGKGVDFHGANPWSDGTEGGAFPTGTTLLTGVGPDPTALNVGDANPLCHNSNSDTTNPFPSNFTCNPSSIDGLSITNSSQGGGGIFAHGWAHHLQIANNRVFNNAGTLTGGISVGQGEFPTPYIQGGTTNAAPGSCSDGTGWVTNQHLPYCLQLEVNVHNNSITSNSSLGDELFSGTLSGGGGATFCTGNDYYKFNYNWVCGNVSSGEGGGLVHLGEIQYGDIEHNSIVLNQSNNPTIPTNGGGIQIMGTPDTDPICGMQIDADCPPGLSDGTGHGLVINANLIQANMAESGSGGGIRLQQVNGTDVSTFPGVYAITAADEAHTVRIRVPATATLPAVGDSVTIAGVSVAGYNGTFTVNAVGNRLFTYLDGTIGLGTGTGGTFTDTTTAGTAQTITNAVQTGGGVVTITSTLSPAVGDIVVITGVTPTGFNGTYTVTEVPTVGTFTYTDPRNLLTAGTGGTVTDSNQTSAALWNSVSITNNIIVNNVAGWDGGGISLQDSLNVSIVNNTIAKNDTLASSGVLTQSLGTPDASAPAGSCVNAAGTTSCPQSAGVTSTQNSTLMTTSLTGLTVICPFGKTNCAGFSNPVLLNDLIWQNRAFKIGITGPGTGGLNQQNLVALFNSAGAAVPSQTSTGACNSNDTYWDLGVRGDTGPTNHGSGFTLTAQNTLSTTTSGSSQPRFISSYCNGSRVPVECSIADGCGGPSGYGVPPGIADALTPNPVFTLTPAATVDEGNNWINVSWGPLSLSNDALAGPTGNYGGGLSLGNYGLDPNSGAIDRISTGETVPVGVTVPTTDFFGNPRPNPDGGRTFDYGAVETQTTVTTVSATLTSISPNSGLRGAVVPVTLTGTNLAGTTAINVSGTGVTVSDIGVVSNTSVVATFTIGPAATLGARNVSATTSVGTTNTVTFTVTIPTPTLSAIAPITGQRGTTVAVTLTGTNLTGGTIGIAPNGGGSAITVNSIVVNTAGTVMTANFVIPSGAATTTRTITVTAGGATSNGVTFTVTAPPTPTLTSISPASGARASAVPVTLTGTNFITGATVAVSGGGITVSGVTVVSPTSITATFTMSAGASVSARNVTVTAGGATSNAVPFTVQGATVASISPTSGLHNTTVPVSITGTNLAGATAVTMGGGITCSGITSTATSVTASCAITNGATHSTRNVRVTTPIGQTPTNTAVTFTVN